MADIIVPKRYMFAIEGQIYETDNVLTIKEDLDPEQYVQLVRDTVFQVAFMEALKNVMPHFSAVKGLHPNLKNMAKFEKDDEDRLQCLKETVKILKETDPLLLTYDMDKLISQAAMKMYSAISEIPDAWTKDGTLKPEFIEHYRKDIFRLDDL